MFFMEGLKLRSEQEILDLILNIAEKDERIRAVIMNGSRTNPNATKDCFQDFDIIYVVTNMNSFTCNHNWIDIFGERIMLQMPETHELQPPVNDGRFNYQMLFSDFNRIDLVLVPIERVQDILQQDSLTEILMDKDNIMPEIPKPSDCDYYITVPTQKLFNDCCNDFWWVLQNIAKGICRDELPFAMRMLEYDRSMLDHMTSWYIGTIHGYQISTGKCGKYFKKYLEADLYQMYCDTFSNSDYKNMWDAVFAMCTLFRILALEVSGHFGFSYKYEDDRKMMEYLTSVCTIRRE